MRLYHATAQRFISAERNRHGRPKGSWRKLSGVRSAGRRLKQPRPTEISSNAKYQPDPGQRSPIPRRGGGDPSETMKPSSVKTQVGLGPHAERPTEWGVGTRASRGGGLHQTPIKLKRCESSIDELLLFQPMTTRGARGGAGRFVPGHP